jgi:hypothetical protein
MCNCQLLRSTLLGAVSYGMRFSSKLVNNYDCIRYENCPWNISHYLVWCPLTLSPLMLHIRGVFKKFGGWYQKTNKTEDTNKLTLLAFKIIAILHNTLLPTFIKLLETVRKGLFRNRSQNACCEGWRLLWRQIKLIYLYLLLCLFSGTIHRPF